MNLIKIYGKLVELKVNIEWSLNQFGTSVNCNIKRQKKIHRLIEIVEYKLGIRSQDMITDFDKNSWYAYSFTDNYIKDENYNYYLRTCCGCGNNYLSLKSLHCGNVKCYDCRIL